MKEDLFSRWNQGVPMQQGYARTSLILFGISVLLLIAMTLFESVLVGASPAMERIITFLALVLPAGVGFVLGGLSLARREGKPALALAGLLLNGLFALFHLSIVLLAG
jgi:hypothetical protein